MLSAVKKINRPVQMMRQGGFVVALPIEDVHSLKHNMMRLMYTARNIIVTIQSGFCATMGTVLLGEVSFSRWGLTL
jgi:hypothetical protein